VYETNAHITSRKAKEEQMIRTMVVTVSLLVLLFAGFAFGSTQVLKVDIPFEFHVGADAFPAGEYWIELEKLTSGSPTGATLLLRTKDGTVFHRTLTIPSSAAFSTGESRITFNRYGDQYFLAEVGSSGYTASLRRSPLEKNLAAQTDGGHQVRTGAE
jgi:hypothetical protein